MDDKVRLLVLLQIHLRSRWQKRTRAKLKMILTYEGHPVFNTFGEPKS